MSIVKELIKASLYDEEASQETYDLIHKISAVLGIFLGVVVGFMGAGIGGAIVGAIVGGLVGTVFLPALGALAVRIVGFVLAWAILAIPIWIIYSTWGVGN